MIIKELNAEGLEEFIYSDEFKTSEVIPISKHRAISQINNTRLKKSDKILFLAYIDNHLAGYIGVLPDQIFYNNQEIHAGWLSCIWVDGNMRGKGIAHKLLQTALDSWNGKILATEFTSAAKALYDKSNTFTDALELQGLRGYLRFNFHEILPPKSSLFKKTKPILKIIDSGLNLINGLRLLFWKSKIAIDFKRLEYVNTIDMETSRFITSKQKDELIRRNTNELNWIMKYPWILNTSDKDSFSDKYHFSSLDKSFESISIKLTGKNGQTIAFLMLVFRNRNLKIPYCYFEKENCREVVNVILYHMIKKNMNVVTVFNESIADCLRKYSTPFFHTRKIKRAYIISKSLHESIGYSKIHIQDGDGDCAFT